MKPSILIVDDRPGTFTENAFARQDVEIVLLRFPGKRNKDYLARWSHLAAFQIEDGESIEDAARRYRRFASSLNNPPTYFCNPHEPLQDSAQEFAQRAGLPFLTKQQVRWVREKPSMKDRYREHSIPHAAYEFVQSAEDVIIFAAIHGWPVIVKPSNSFACIATYKVTGPEEIPDLDPRRIWIVEEFVSGREFQLCSLIVRGRVQAAFLSANPQPILNVLEGAMNANITFSRAEAHPVDEYRVCQTLADTFHIERGYLHGECFVTDDGEFVMSEVAARISGCEVPENHGRAYGFDIHRAILDCYLDEYPRLDYTRDVAVGDLLLPITSGRVRAVSAWENIAVLPGVTGGRIHVAVGDLLDPPRASMASSGYVHVEGRNVAEVEARMERVLAEYRLEIDVDTDGSES